MKRIAVGCWIGIAALVALSGDEGPLSAVVHSAAAQFPGTIAVYVRQLKTGETVAFHGDDPMDSMSVIKLGIAAKAYQMAERGHLRLDDRVVLKASDRRGGSGVWQHHSVGIAPTVRDLIIEMIITSDNTATDLVLARVGGVAALNAWLDQSGYPALRMNATIAEYFRDYMAAFDPSARKLSTSDVWDAMSGPAIGGAKSPAAAAVSKRVGELWPDKWFDIARQFYRDRSRWLGSITASGIGTFLGDIEAAHLVSPAHSKELIRIMTWQKAGARRIPHYIEDWYEIAHKTGDGPPSVANDVGIVYLDSGPVVVVILANDIRGNYGEAEDAEGRLAQRIAEHFDGPRKP